MKTCPVWADEPEAPWRAVIHPGARMGDGRTIGYADYLLPVAQDRSTLWAIDSKTVFSSYGDSEENVGLVFRRLVGDEAAIVGANFFYDARYTPANRYVHQLGTGLEVIGPTLEGRANAYFALSGKELLNSAAKYAFAGTQVVRRTTNVYEEQMPGFDYEAGLLVPFVSDVMETRVFAGGYYYFSELGKDVPGARGRIEVRPSPFFTLQLEVKRDRTIDNDYFAGGYFTLPFDLGGLFRGKNPFAGAEKTLRIGQKPRPLRERMTDPVVRDIDIVTREDSERVEETVVPKILFVDNRNDLDAFESGSFEHPYNTLAEAVADPRFTSGAWMYVAAGDGTSVGYASSVTLSAGQVFWGEGYEAFPGLGGGNYPRVGAGANAITAAARVTVQGFQVQNFTGAGVVAENADGVMIRNNRFFNITDHLNDGDDIMGIQAGSTATPMTGYILDNEFSNIRSAVGDNGVGIVAISTATANFTIRGNRIDGTDIGINNVALTGGTLNSDMERNVIENSNVGVVVRDGDNSAAVVGDLGNGALTSVGGNSFRNIGTADIVADREAVTAQNNYFAGGAGTFALLNGGTVDGTNFLATDPN